jgi:hypothetical protein
MTPATALPAVPGRYLDTNTVCTGAVLDAVVLAGFLGVIRYVPLQGVNASADISNEELERMLVRKLRSAWVQHPRFPGWDPAAHNGETDALVACNHAKLAGYADGTTGYLDLEGMSPKATVATASKFARDWIHVAVNEGARPGIYIGFDIPLGPLELWEFPYVHTYWSDMGHRKVAQRGCAINQGASTSIAGTVFDVDYVADDLLGELPFFTGAVEVA